MQGSLVQRSLVFALVAALASALALAGVAGTAEAKGKPAGKGKTPSAAYVFKGTVASVGDGSVTVDVEKGNKAARSFVGQELRVSVNDSTKVRKDDAESSLDELAEGDEVLVKSRAPRGATSFVAQIVVAHTPAVEEAPSEEEPVS